MVACWLSVCNTLHSISSNSKKAKCELSYTNRKNVEKHVIFSIYKKKKNTTKTSVFLQKTFIILSAEEKFLNIIKFL